ncbi:MAG TPA: HD domain-containing phosphohydrolase [Longimicrobiaceae bacterium]|nr:HD domain-containing phosphohydrolase [Longimicrobiaceae bacterium]
MPKPELRKQAATLAGMALASAGAMGVAWLADAMRRENATRRLHRQVVDLLLNALTADDPVTARHSRRVADLSFALGQAAGLDRDRMATLRVAALLHDMGKIDDRFFVIVHSRKPLSEEQRAQIKHHPHQSAAILEPLEERHPGLMKIVSSHHECWDGSGYPCGLAGEEIPLEARIIALADVFDAMTQPRSYKQAMPVEEALEKLDEGCARQFDPHLVDLIECEPVLDRWIQIAHEGLDDELRHLAHPNPTERELAKVATD